MNAIKLDNDQKFNQIEINHGKHEKQNNIQPQNFVCYHKQALRSLAEKKYSKFVRTCAIR